MKDAAFIRTIRDIFDRRHKTPDVPDDTQPTTRLPTAADKVLLPWATEEHELGAVLDEWHAETELIARWINEIAAWPGEVGYPQLTAIYAYLVHRTTACNVDNPEHADVIMADDSANLDTFEALLQEKWPKYKRPNVNGASRTMGLFVNATKHIFGSEYKAVKSI